MSGALAGLLESRAPTAGGVLAGDERADWATLHDGACRRAAALATLRGRRVAVHGRSPLAVVEVLAALDAVGAEAVLAAPGGRASPGRAVVWLDADDPGMSVSGDLSAAGAPSCVGVFSSGTTGDPHIERWSWTALLDGVRLPAAVRGGRWVSFYPLDTFAGLQALAAGVSGADEFVLVGPEGSLAAVAGAHSIRLVMATPTLWRRMLLLEPPGALSALELGTISMGGEPADEHLLKRLAATFSGARIVHVYASSEHGSLFSVADGRAGFPVSWLGRRRSSGAELTVRDGELYVSTARGRPPVATGDAVRMEGDRVVFLGRRDAVINVGGRKVDRERVLATLRGAPGVSDAHVYAMTARLTGSLVAADVVLAEGGELAAVHAHCCARLAPHERPRRLRPVDVLAVSTAGKETFAR